MPYIIEYLQEEQLTTSVYASSDDVEACNNPFWIWQALTHTIKDPKISWGLDAQRPIIFETQDEALAYLNERLDLIGVYKITQVYIKT